MPQYNLSDVPGGPARKALRKTNRISKRMANRGRDMSDPYWQDMANRRGVRRTQQMMARPMGEKRGSWGNRGAQRGGGQQGGGRMQQAQGQPMQQAPIQASAGGPPAVAQLSQGPPQGPSQKGKVPSYGGPLQPQQAPLGGVPMDQPVAQPGGDMAPGDPLVGGLQGQGAGPVLAPQDMPALLAMLQGQGGGFNQAPGQMNPYAGALGMQPQFGMQPQPMMPQSPFTGMPMGGMFGGG